MAATPDPFRTRDHVPDFDRHVADYAARSAATRARLLMRTDIAYGPSPAERLDLFLPPPHAATGAVHMFIHGGYWRMFAKEDFSFVAETVTQAGAIAVIVDYALMPAVRMETLVAQIRRACAWVVDRIGEHGGDPARFTLSGHSAGAHLAALMLAEQEAARSIKGALLLSGIYDLAPLQKSFLKDLIALTDDEVARFSPLRRDYRADGRVSLAVGARETPPFHAQAADFARRLSANGLDVQTSMPAEDHMSIVASLGTGGTDMATRLAHLLAPER